MTRRPRRLMFRPELRQVVGSSYTTIWKMMRQGKFPRSVVVGKGRVGWFDDEVEEYLENLPRQRLKGDDATDDDSDGEDPDLNDAPSAETHTGGSAGINGPPPTRKDGEAQS